MGTVDQMALNLGRVLEEEATQAGAAAVVVPVPVCPTTLVMAA